MIMCVYQSQVSTCVCLKMIGTHVDTETNQEMYVYNIESIQQSNSTPKTKIVDMYFVMNSLPSKRDFVLF